MAVQLEFIQFFSEPFGTLYHEANNVQKQILFMMLVGQKCILKRSRLPLPGETQLSSVQSKEDYSNKRDF